MVGPKPGDIGPIKLDHLMMMNERNHNALDRREYLLMKHVRVVMQCLHLADELGRMLQQTYCCSIAVLRIQYQEQMVYRFPFVS
ncbi:hypothetical protein CEXT_227471 [Caerostris extrusa]|uniref:Uncharacterized protein n=1 Tax=Caerostris extrusa TaxID=172846 RepID=A0AAV4WR04_CAEEX|nr:hypothetical protein CEXT_227471 [Caerostris extrusa]